jgi:putative membrane protein
MKKLKFALTALAMTAGSMGLAHADLSHGDTDFIKKAAAAGQLEISTSQLADQHAGSADVKTFAQMMVTDHTKVADDLKALAASKNVTLPADVPRSTKSEVDSLSKKNGTDFDKKYTADVAVSAHKDAVKLFEKEAKDGKDADVKAFAAKNLPTLQEHYSHGQALQKTVKAEK